MIKQCLLFYYPGLCGDFNDVEADDFKTNGMIAGTAVTFANTWRAKPSCPDVTNRLSNPCQSVDKGRPPHLYPCSLSVDTSTVLARASV